MNTIPHVIVIGCGFGGLAAAKGLADLNVKVTLIDRNNYHCFKPLLPMVALAELSPFSISAPVRTIFRNQKNVSVLMTDVLSVDLKQKQIVTGEGTLSFDQLVIATGAEPNHFGNDNWAKLTMPLSTLSDARQIRNRILSSFEQAESICSVSSVHPEDLLNFVIVGAGSTGIELAGSFATLVKKVLSNRDFRSIEPSTAKIYLVELADRVLPVRSISPEHSRYAAELLTSKGVEVLTSCKVTKIDESGVWVERARASGTAADAAERSFFIPAKTVIWSAGVQAAPLTRTLGIALDRSGRVPVNGSLNIEGHDCVYVIGDAARYEQDGKPLPGVASAAKQMGDHVAKTIAARLSEDLEKVKDFEFTDQGTVVTVTDGHGIAVFGKRSLTGFPGWLIWLVAHVYFLIGHRNRSLVITQWLFSWLSASRGARIITAEKKPCLDCGD